MDLLWNELRRLNDSLNVGYICENIQDKIKQDHDGMSLARNALSGGHWGDAANGISGPFYWSPNLQKTEQHMLRSLVPTWMIVLDFTPFD